MKIVYFHGANSTSHSFEFLKAQLDEFNSFCVDYSEQTAIERNVLNISTFLNGNIGNEDVYFIGHSLGGIIAAALTHHLPQVKRLVTIASPFGGSKVADWLTWTYPQCQLFRDIRTSSKSLHRIRNAGSKVPNLSIVTEKGSNTVFGEPNDGTVSVASQLSFKAYRTIHLNLNHFEVLLSKETADHIREWLTF